MVRNHDNAPSQKCDRGAFYLVGKVGGITRKLLVHDPILLYQIVLLYQHQKQQPVGVGVKALLRAA
jgi:hypothetical protein